jgi:hypothetical protein
MKRNPDDDQQSEFGLGLGLIDETSRADRAITPEQELQEIYSLPKTFDNTMPDRPKSEDTPVPRLLRGETEADRG